MKHKKKVWLILGLVFLVIVLVISILFFRDQEEKKMIQSYIKQLTEEKVTVDDEIGKQLETRVSTYQEIMGKLEQTIEIDTIFQNPEQMQQQVATHQTMLQEMEQQLALFQIDSIASLFEPKYHQQISYIRKKYEESKFYQKIEDLEEQLKKEKQRDEDITAFSSYLLNHVNDWKYFDSVLYYEKEEVGNMLKEYQEKLSFQTPIEKGVLSYTTAHIPIFMYHGVSDNVWGNASLFVSPSDFEQQMKYLSENGYTPIFMHEIEHLDSSVQKPVVITFDDGNLDVYQEAYPILKKYNIKATVFIISGYGDGVYSMTHDQAKELSDSGLISIQSHTVSHEKLANLSESEIEEQLRDSKNTLEQLTGKSVHTVAYPIGSYDKRVIEIAKKYYQYGVLMGGGTAYIHPDMSDFEIKRIGIFRNDSLSYFKSMCQTSKR